MTLFNDIMPYFDEFIPVYGWNMSILWSPLKIWTSKKFTTANFRHPVSKSWLRHCYSHHFVLAKLATSSIRVKGFFQLAISYLGIWSGHVSTPFADLCWLVPWCTSLSTSSEHERRHRVNYWKGNAEDHLTFVRLQMIPVRVLARI